MDIQIKNLSVKFGEKQVFEDFSQTFKEGEITCILGASGVGKTTILNAIAGNVEYSGEVLRDGGAASYIFQSERLVPTLSVRGNLDLVLRGKIADKLERERAVLDMLKAVELSDDAKRFPKELSGGMSQRVAIARGFLFPSKILLMDEAFKGLDTALKARLISLFVSLWQQNPKTVVFVTHSIDEALLLSHRVIVIKGSPARAVLDQKITVPVCGRSLTDKDLEDARKALLFAVVGEISNNCEIKH
jgi:NitT/TauT family transport system ATP-binding protein